MKKIPQNKSEKMASIDNSETAQIYLHQAELFKNQGKWEQGITACQEALSLNPQMASAYKIWGDILQQMTKLEEAIGYYAKALAINPNLSEVYVNLGGIFFKRQAWELAISYYQKAIAINPELAAAYRNLSRIYKRLGQEELMLKNWELALKSDPSSATAQEHCKLGKIFLQQQKTTEAINCYQRAIKLQPNFLEPLLAIVDLLTQLSKWDETSKYCEKIIQLQPDNWQAYYYSGNVALQQEKWQDAIALYQRVIRLNPHHLLSYLNLAQAYLALSQWQAAIKYARQAIAIEANAEKAYFYLGIALSEQQELTDAVSPKARHSVIAAFTQVLKLNPYCTKTYYLLGKALISLGKFSEAELCYQQLAKIISEKEIDYKHIGELFLKKEKWVEAAKYLEISIRYNPNDFWAHHNLGRVLCELKQWEWAMRILQQAITINSDFSWSYYHLAVALENQNYLTEATKNYRIFVNLEPNVYGYQSLGNILTNQARKQQPEDQLMLEEAWHCYCQGIELNPDYLSLYYQALDVKPNDSELLFLLAEAHIRQEEWEVAIIFYQMGFQAVGGVNNSIFSRSKNNFFE